MELDTNKVNHVICSLVSLFLEDAEKGKQYPQGPLFAALMTVGVNLNEFLTAVDLLEDIKVISRTSETMTYLHPERGTKAHAVVEAVNAHMKKLAAEAKAEMN